MERKDRKCVNSRALGLLSELLCDILAQLLSAETLSPNDGKKSQYMVENSALLLITVCFSPSSVLFLTKKRVDTMQLESFHSSTLCFVIQHRMWSLTVCSLISVKC